MDLIVRTKHAARKVAMCIKAIDGSKTPQRNIIGESETSVRGTGKWTGNTADRISTLALQLLCVICVWGPNAEHDHMSLANPPLSPAMARPATPYGYRYEHTRSKT